MTRQLPRLLALPLLVCLLASLAFVAIGQAAMSSLASVIDPSRIHLSLPQAPSPTDTVWLCKPGMTDNPCAGDLSTTVIGPDGNATYERSAAVKKPPIDCFYVYPTVSLQRATNANLHVDPEERGVAKAEASRFSQVCDVYAPMYPQLTKAAINDPSSISITGEIEAYEGVWKAYLDYMDHYNDGRGVVFIGHSQGAFLLTMLLQAEVDTEPQVLERLVSAILPGGNITVEAGKRTGGDFHNIPACSSPTELGCVVAYSSFTSEPTEDALFGRMDSPINPFHQNSPLKLHVLCVNPTSVGGGRGAALPYLPTADLTTLVGNAWPRMVSETPFVAYPREYTARCESSDHANWLQIDRTEDPSDTRPSVATVSSERWGLHMVDMSIVMGNLVGLVRTQAAAYQARH
jgi:hypothetical protein